MKQFVVTFYHFVSLNSSMARFSGSIEATISPVGQMDSTGLVVIFCRKYFLQKFQRVTLKDMNSELIWKNFFRGTSSLFTTL